MWLTLDRQTHRQDTFQTFFCKDLNDPKGRPAPSDNFCKAVKGAVLPSVGTCCIRSSDFNKIQSLSKGCAANGLTLGMNQTPCSP
ncbi:hypothetical protein CMUS01_08105 [Colletotrichum musicola]|uniref:Uncharacterized protein n=1 Tax=Colletotrichum musicola TaxID=2175873 RepID=A0A8H6NED6_9PEZI|nr:hypothetical protein CMUS01_08105 [Colletotrichum musicola]